MYDRDKLAQLRQEMDKWEETTLQRTMRAPSRTPRAVYHHLFRADRSRVHAPGC